MSLKNLALDVESIALALSEEGGYEYYHIDDDLKELAKNVSDMQAENAKLRMLIDLKQTCWKYVGWCSECPYNGLDDEHDDCNCTVREKVNSLARELGIEVD